MSEVAMLIQSSRKAADSTNLVKLCEVSPCSRPVGKPVGYNSATGTCYGGCDRRIGAIALSAHTTHTPFMENIEITATLGEPPTLQVPGGVFPGSATDEDVYAKMKEVQGRWTEWDQKGRPEYLAKELSGFKQSMINQLSSLVSWLKPEERNLVLLTCSLSNVEVAAAAEDWCKKEGFPVEVKFEPEIQCAVLVVAPFLHKMYTLQGRNQYKKEFSDGVGRMVAAVKLNHQKKLKEAGLAAAIETAKAKVAASKNLAATPPSGTATKSPTKPSVFPPPVKPVTIEVIPE